MFSIVIPALNEEKELPKLLESLKNQTQSNFEVIVADAHSKDKTREICRSYGARIVDGGLISFGRNAGARVAKNDVFIFLDADITVDPDFIEKIEKQFVPSDLDITSAYTYWDTDSIQANFAYAMWDFSKLTRQRNKRPDGSGNCIIVRRKAFEAVNGFSEKRKIGNDSDFIARVALAGFKFRMIKLRIHPSPRRYKKYGLFRVWIGNFMAGLIKVNDAEKQERALKIYGGWGRHASQSNNTNNKPKK
jgi:glycosyltransferase involved in cell wall biosynthesis